MEQCKITPRSCFDRDKNKENRIEIVGDLTICLAPGELRSIKGRIKSKSQLKMLSW